jgi:phospholipid/cholesterol/gamma-HCH transport system substrate-binding protein
MNNGDGALSKLISDKEFASSLKNTFSNLEASSNQFASFTTKLNNGTLGVALDSTMSNIQSATKGLSENMEAAQHSFLLKGFFKKKKRTEAKKQADLNKVIDINKKKDAKDSIDSVKQ